MCERRNTRVAGGGQPRATTGHAARATVHAAREHGTTRHNGAMAQAEDDATGDDAALDEIAAELYALPPEGFTAARNERASSAPRALAARVKALRKPSVAAWAVDLLARQGQLAEAVELSAALREAQDDLDAAELAALGRQRRALVGALAAEAVRLADEQGVSVSSAAREEVEKTINAAVVDAAAAAAVLTGRLVRTLEPGGTDEATLAEAVGGSLPGATAGAAPRPSRDDLAERRARKAAEKAAREAERAATEAERELARIEARRGKIRERRDHLRERIDDLRAELERFEADEAQVQDDLTAADAEHETARTAAAAARKASDAAQKAIDAPR